MTYLITGATGFIGKRLVARLLGRGDGTVYVVVREASLAKLEPLYRRWGVDRRRVVPIVGDLALPGLGLGIALKVDDGAKRGSERALAEVLAVFLPGARKVLAEQLEGEIFNWRGTSVGRIVAAPPLTEALAALETTRPGRAKGAAG